VASVAVAAAAVALALAAAPVPASAATAASTSAAPVPGSAAAAGIRRPAGGVFHLRGKGLGHGRGLSQYGAQARAAAGQGYRRILRAYYPGTTLARGPAGTVKVRLLDAGGRRLRVHAERGLSAWWRGPAGAVHHRVLPTRMSGCRVGLWRAHRQDTRLSIDARSCGRWHTLVPARRVHAGGPVSFLAADGMVALADFDRRIGYRGYLRATVARGVVQVTNVVGLDAYLRSVVAAEVPASWRPAALAAQAVAARSYARYAIVHAGRRGYDLVDSSAAQVYPGAVRYDRRWRVAARAEHPRTDAAVARTARQVLRWHGAVALAEFGSSNGGYTADGGLPYLRAGRDRFDPAFGWTDTVRAARLQKAYPAIGRLQQLRLTRRAGSGSWGGRVDAVTLIGSRGRTTVRGEDAVRFLLGVRSTDLAVVSTG